MRSPLKKCRLCCSLRVGSMSIGFLYFMLGIAGIILSIMAFSNENSLNNMTIANNNTDDTQDSELETGAVWLQSFQFVVSILTFMFAICVLIAAWMNSNSGLLLPWLFFQPLLTMIGFISTGYYAVWYWRDRDITMVIVYSAASFFIAGIGFIFWWVIFSYYRELSKNDKNKNKANHSEEKDEEESILPPSEKEKAKIVRRET